jgi:DNA polymerase III epsilon subunit-like protein
MLAGISSNNKPRKTLFLDTETTGLYPPRDKMVEVAIVDDEGNTVLDTLVNPQQAIGDAKKIHGITDEMVQSAPTLRELWPTIEAIVVGCDVVIYNADYDVKFFPKRLAAANSVLCCMNRFAGVYGDWNEHHQSFTWKPLKVAMNYVGGHWSGKSHRALADALACRTVWNWLEDQAEFNDRLPVLGVANDLEVPF